MSGDYSRRRFDKKLDFSAVFSQQGRVQLDSDWNEQNEILSRRLRAETIGIIGHAIVPLEEGKNQGAFAISVNNGHLTIGPGRIFVDGHMAENHGGGDLEAGTLVFDPVLEEDCGKQAVNYEDQPFMRGAANILQGIKNNQVSLVFLDVWQREVTCHEYPDMVENAVAVDTTTRMQTAWQVKMLPVAPATPDALPDSLTMPSGARLSTGTVDSQVQGDGFCQLPPNAGYLGLDNRLYRVEIHDGGPGGDKGTATFKWSRDNASLGAAITAVSSDRTVLTVSTTGNDSAARFQPDDWIEVTDDKLEFESQPGLPNQRRGGGVLAKISIVSAETSQITLSVPLPANTFAADDATRHTRVRKWDQKGKVYDEKGNLWVDLDQVPSNSGVIPVPKSGASLVLEDGIKITFNTPDGAEYHVADYWNFAARTADASVEGLNQAPPRGVHHHFCLLARLVGQAPSERRSFWPPVIVDQGCECTVCVSVSEYNANKAKGDTDTIQRAVEAIVKAGGGTLCLGPGTYSLGNTIKLDSPFAAVHVRGCGQSTILLQPPAAAAFSVTGVGITIEDLQVWPTPDARPGKAAFAIDNVLDFSLQRCWVSQVLRGGIPTGPAVTLGNVVVAATIRDCNLTGTYGVTTDNPGHSDVVTYDLRILDNNILAMYGGVTLGNVFTAGETRISGNSIIAGVASDEQMPEHTGIRIANIGALDSRISVDANHIVVNQEGLGKLCQTTAAIFVAPLATGNMPVVPAVVRIVQNDIFVNWGTFAAYAIAIGGLDGFDHLLVEGNSARGTNTRPSANDATVWLGIGVEAVSRGAEYGRHECSILGNSVAAIVGLGGRYTGVLVGIPGDCAVSNNCVSSDNPSAAVTAGDVRITAATVVACNNRVRGAAMNSTKELNSIEVTAAGENATVLGNVCPGNISRNSVRLTNRELNCFR